jgi:alpha-glucoside transport system permease protein
VTDTVDREPEVEAPEDEGLDLGFERRRNPAQIAARVIGTIAVPVVAFTVMIWAFGFLRDSDANRIVIALVAIAVGVAGVFGVFWGMDRAVNWLPERWREGVRPYVFIGPALVLLSVFLIYPVINTVLLSFRDSRGQAWIGLENYQFVFTDAGMLRSIRNTAMWIIVVPAVAVSIGLVFATLADRLRRLESVAKSLIFLPMAISFVGAFVTFRLIYSYRPAGFGSNIGLLNGIMEAFGQDPVSWLSLRPWNNLLLMVIMIWMQTGFAMVVLSASIKAIPDEIIEAARIDGASELQVFCRIVIPTIMPTVVVVTTYMVVNAMKVFDIVFVMGSPEANGTEVIADRMIRWFFIANHDGRAAAIAVVLFLGIIPVMVWNVRKFREQEAQR